MKVVLAWHNTFDIRLRTRRGRGWGRGDRPVLACRCQSFFMLFSIVLFVFHVVLHCPFCFLILFFSSSYCCFTLFCFIVIVVSCCFALFFLLFVCFYVVAVDNSAVDVSSIGSVCCCSC